MSNFSLIKTDPDSRARVGVLRTAHGDIETPIFMPVGTQASVKTVHPDELRRLGAQVILANTYHLYLRPGIDLIKRFGGLHPFANWDRAILTDSGGYQVFSLAKLRKITPEGVSFRSHIDGSECYLNPEIAMQAQAGLGSDIAMLFDECPPYPCERAYAEQSLDLTLSWAKRCRAWVDTNHPQASLNAGRQLHFGIVQGSNHADLRERSARELVQMGWDGYAIGGVSVGEPEEVMMQSIDQSIPHLPAELPRYAMGLGTPPQMLAMIARGVDMFDCVLPTRLARHGMALTADGPINIKNHKFLADKKDLDENTAPECQGFSRAYVRHLFRSGEVLGIRLLTLHNLHFSLDLLRHARCAIQDGNFNAFTTDFTARYLAKKNN